MSQRVFLHTLSAPEVIWLNFWREFFSQKELMADTQTGRPLPNRFFLDKSIDPSNRPFDVVLANDFFDAKTNALPAFVIEDAGGAQQLGMSINQVKHWHVTPNTIKERADQIRFTYVFHCLSKDRGESRLLASVTTFALTVFREAILSNAPMIKIEPWSVSPTQALRGDSQQDYFDTPVQVTFTTMEIWSQLEIGEGTAEEFAVNFSSDERSRFIRGFMETVDPRLSRYVLASMALVNPDLVRFINAGMTIDSALNSEVYVLSAMTTENPVASERFIRAQMRVSN